MDFNRKRCERGAVGATEFAKQRYPSIAAIDTRLPRALDITTGWRTKFDWFTVAPRLHVPDEQTAAGRDKEWLKMGFRPHIELELSVQGARGGKVLPATTAFTNRAYVKFFQRPGEIDQLKVWTPR